MPPQQKDKQQAEPEKPERRQLNAVVGKQVMDILGQPLNLQRVQVRQLWDDHYRVNVFIGQDATACTVAHSYFLTVDGAGHIVASNPKIVKQHGKMEA